LSRSDNAIWTARRSRQQGRLDYVDLTQVTKPETPWQAALSMLQYCVLGTEVAFAFVGPLVVVVVHRNDGVFDAGCVAVGWVLVLAHLFTLWSSNHRPGH